MYIAKMSVDIGLLGQRRYSLNRGAESVRRSTDGQKWGRSGTKMTRKSISPNLLTARLVNSNKWHGSTRCSGSYVAAYCQILVLVYQGMNCKFFCTSLYCNTAKGYNLNPCKLTIHSPEHEYHCIKTRQKVYN